MPSSSRFHWLPRRALSVLLGLVPVCSAFAQPTSMPFNPLQIVEQQGQVMYCQQAYSHPDNVSRVYPYDTEQCAAAERYLQAQVAVFPEDVRSDLAGLARREASRILANTRDITAVLGTCRETCQAIAARATPPADGAEPGSAEPQP